MIERQRGKESGKGERKRFAYLLKLFFQHSDTLFDKVSGDFKHEL